jgi:hypothetical protein
VFEVASLKHPLLFSFDSSYHSMLPPEGIDQKALQKTASTDEMFRNYLNARSLANWKFWIVSFPHANAVLLDVFI